MNIFTLKNLKHTLYVGAAAGAILLGSMIVTNATGKLGYDPSPKFIDIAIFGTQHDATDTCQEPDETKVILGEASGGTTELSRSFLKSEDTDKINFYFFLRGLETHVTMMEVYRDVNKPGEVFLVMYEKDLTGKPCAAVTSQDGSKGFWLTDEQYFGFLKAAGIEGADESVEV